MTTNLLAPGLADPPHDAQRLFRGVLEAFSHPGRIIQLRDPHPVLIRGNMLCHNIHCNLAQIKIRSDSGRGSDTR